MPRQIQIGGAGISGLTAAINLKLAGFDVTVFEKNAEVGAQHHNDFQGLENWTQEEDILAFLKRINIGTDFYYKPCHEVNVFDYQSNKSVARSRVPFLYLVKRGPDFDSLDQYLKRKAEKLGVKIEFKKAVKPEEVDIVATGPSTRKGLGYGILFKTNLADCLSVIIDNRIAPYGYAYLIVVDGRGTLAVVLFSHFQKVKEYFSRASERFKNLSQFQIKEAKEFSGFANAAIFEEKEKIYVGEAGGFQDMFWGFGMRYAFLSGYSASQAILNKQDYWRVIRKEIHPWMKASAVNYLFLRFLKNKGLSWLIKKVGASSDQRKILQRAYRLRFYKKIIYPFAKIILKI